MGIASPSRYWRNVLPYSNCEWSNLKPYYPVAYKPFCWEIYWLRNHGASCIDLAKALGSTQTHGDSSYKESADRLV